MAYINEFLRDLTAQLNLNNMDGPQRAALKKLQSNGTATKDQQNWNPGDPDPLVAGANLPDPLTGQFNLAGAMTPYGISLVRDWQDIYLMFQKVLRNLDLNRVEIADKYPDVEKFLNDFYGPGAPIEKFQVIDTVVNNVVIIQADLVPYLNDASIGAFLQTNGISSNDRKNLISTINDGSYKNNPKSLQVLQDIVAVLESNRLDLAANGHPIPASMTTARLEDIYKNVDEPKKPTAANRAVFRTNGSKRIIQQLVKNDKLRNAFIENDSDKTISRALNKGLEKSNYKDTDSKNYIVPKYTDRKKKWKEYTDGLKNNIKDLTGKFESLQKRFNFSTTAEFMVKEILGSGVKSTDGLGKILENKDKITAGLKNNAPGVVPQFDAFSKLMGKLQTGNKTAFSQALEDGAQMLHIVREVIKDMVHNGKKDDDIMPVLEVLAAMSYDSMTSSSRDGIKGADYDIAKGTSFPNWFKVGVKNSFKVATLITFETSHLIYAKTIRKHGEKFKEGTKRLGDIKDVTKTPDYGIPAKRDQMERMFQYWDFLKSGKTKDWNPFRGHSRVQKDWKAGVGATELTEFRRLNPDIGR